MHNIISTYDTNKTKQISTEQSVERPLSAENSLSSLIKEGPLMISVLLAAKFDYGRLMIDSRLSIIR